MKFGFRTPSLKKSFKARTTGKIKRSIKKSINPMYGKKGMGYIKNPKRALKNSLYNKTTIDIIKPIKKSLFHKDTNKNKISAAKIGLALYTGGLSLLFTGIHKKNNNSTNISKKNTKVKGFLD